MLLFSKRRGWFLSLTKNRFSASARRRRRYVGRGSSCAANGSQVATAGEGLEVRALLSSVTGPSTGLPKATVEINSSTPNGPTAGNFGASVTSLGDLDGDGVIDIAAGTPSLDNGSFETNGGVTILFMNPDGTVKQTSQIDGSTLNGPTLDSYSTFGSSLTSLGDLDGDGVVDLAVGDYGNDEGGYSRGAVHVLLLNSDGSVKQTVEINSSTPNGPVLSDYDYFGSSVASLGDLDGDGVTDLAVGAIGDDEGGSYRGAVHVLLLNSDGSVKQTVEINSSTPNGPVLSDFDDFGSSVASLGDLDGDGILDLAVGALGDNEGGDVRGAVHVLLLNSDGSVKQTVDINSSTPNGPVLSNFDRFGSSVTVLGDLDGDGVTDLAVGAYRGGDSSTGVVHILLLNSDGSVKQTVEINSGTPNGPVLSDGDRFGSSVTALGDLDGDGILDLAVGARGDDEGGSYRGAVHVLFLEPLFTVDFGDAPDAVAGTGPGNYETVLSDNGPRHTIVSGLRLGASVDGDDGTLQNGRANADDVASALPDDEDGVLNPLDLWGTIGAAPSVTLLATNTTGSEATLSGWIDFNSDGVFDNTTERAQAVVSTGTTDGRVTLTFPTIPAGTAGSTYARFRLSTDVAGQESTGAASDGEVEDYVFSITAPSTGLPKAAVEINSGTPNGPVLDSYNWFGSSVASLGDLDGDGVNDVAVGASRDGEGYSDLGAVHVLLLNSDGSLKQTVEINSSTPNGPVLSNNDGFGSSVASLGDLDGDGVNDLAVGAAYADNGAGVVHILLLNSDGSVKQTVEISSATANGPSLQPGNAFGSSLTSLGDLDGDGVNDLAVGAYSDGDYYGGGARSSVFLLSLNADGSVKRTVEINSSTLNGPTEYDFGLGRSLTSVGDLDGDGVMDIAAGAPYSDGGGNSEGAVLLLLLNSDGSVKQKAEINSSTLNGPAISTGHFFGSTLASVGDLDGDGVNDLAVGSLNGNGSAGETDSGAIHILLLNADASVKQAIKLDSSTTGGQLNVSDYFHASLTSLGDLDGDGVNELALGAPGGTQSYSPESGFVDGGGNLHVLFLEPVDVISPTVAVSLDDTSLSAGETATVTFTFSEEVVDFTADDVAVENGVLTGLAITADPLVYSATFTPTADVEAATNVISVGTNYSDAAGNAGLAGVSANYSIDTLAPTVVITPDGTSTSESSIVFTFQFSEAVSGFEAVDVSITNGSAGTFTSVDADTFTLEVTPSAGGEVTVSVANGAAQDAVGNNSAAASAMVNVAVPVDVTLPGAGIYEVLRDGADLVVRAQGGAELSRDVAADVSVLRITGAAGDDVVTVLDSGTPVDTRLAFTGNDGNDRFDASLATGAVNLTGSGGDDVLIGGSADDTLNGGSGKDELVGNAGDDLVQGNGGTGDTLDGGDGNDTLNGGSGNDLIRETFTGDVVLTNATMTGRGTDTVISAERAELTGGGEAQTIDVSTFFTSGLTSVTLDGAGGNDTLLGSDGSDVLVGSGGSDRIEGNSGHDRIIGGSGADTLIGGDGDDFIKGLGGSGDRLSGGDGNDTLNGGRGVDRVIETGDVDFTLTNTSLTGLGTDVVQSIEIAELNGGTSGNVIDVSTFSGFKGFTILRGNGGDDSIVGSAMNDVISGGDGNDTLLGKGGDDTLNGEDGDDGLSGFTGNDVIDGGRGFDRGFGGEGNDLLLGGNAADTLIGGDGDDTLAGNDGTDTLVGGTGNNDASMGDVFNDATAVIDEAFMLDPLPGWVDQV
jgi:Ca2+-binding RTX toxin-like protein